MSIFNKKNWKRDNDYETPQVIWDDIKRFLPKDKQIWLPFYCNGLAKNWVDYYKFNTIHDNDNFWDCDKGDVVVDNPPYMIEGISYTKRRIIERLKKLNKPFMLLLPTTTLPPRYFRDLFDKDIQIIIPPTKYNFLKDGIETTGCPFYTLWICWRMGFEKDIMYV